MGRSYEAIIRVNSQSGKGGVAFLLEQDYGLKLPRKLQVEFSRAIQRVTDASEKDLSSTEIWQVFEEEYLNRDDRLYVADSDIELRKGEGGLRSLSINLGRLGKVARYEEAGNGPIDALSKLLTKIGEAEVEVVNYSEHAVGKGADAKAVAYVEVTAPNGQTLFGVGIHSSILTASLRAVVGACNRVAKLS